MLLTKYAKENILEFQMESLQLYGLLKHLLEMKRNIREDGFGFISYWELWEAGKQSRIFDKYDEPFAAMMDMLTVIEFGGLIGRVRASGGSWFGVFY